MSSVTVPRPPILCVIGATASGKSSLAVSVARATGAILLSVDSMQVYCGMDIGTAKPTPAERAAVEHAGIDLVGPDEAYTVAKFVEYADGVIARAAAAGRPVVAVGGTPLYWKALFEGLFDGPPADPIVRDRLRQLDNATLHDRLREADPAAGERIHVNDTKRLIRALEVFELTGRPISTFQTAWADPRPRHDTTWVGLDWDRDALNRRINARVRQMVAAGWVDETRQLLDTFGELSKTAGEATGYHELIEHLRGRSSLDDAIEQIKIATRQLARRQMKWFRRFPRVTWLKGDEPEADLLAATLACWREQDEETEETRRREGHEGSHGEEVQSAK